MVTDLHMPHMHGEVLISILKQINPRLRIIAMSGHPDATTLPLGPLNQCADFLLRKPFKPAQLIHTVSTALAGKA